MSSFNREPVTRRMRRGADGSEQVKRWTLKIELKKKKKKPTTTQFHPGEMSALSVPLLLIHSRSLWFFPCHSTSPSLSAPSVLHLSWSHSVRCSGLWHLISLSFSLSLYELLLSLPLPSERTQVSALTALVQGDNVCNSLPAPRCHSGGPFSCNQTD